MIKGNTQRHATSREHKTKESIIKRFYSTGDSHLTYVNKQWFDSAGDLLTTLLNHWESERKKGKLSEVEFRQKEVIISNQCCIVHFTPRGLCLDPSGYVRSKLALCFVQLCRITLQFLIITSSPTWLIPSVGRINKSEFILVCVSSHRCVDPSDTNSTA